MNPYGTLPMPPTVDLSTVEWLLDSGEDLPRIAARTGVAASTIERALHRSGRADLLAKISRGRTT